MPAQDLAVKAVVTPRLTGGASLAGRRFVPHVGGWLLALPLDGPLLGLVAPAILVLVLALLLPDVDLAAFAVATAAAFAAQALGVLTIPRGREPR